jgi:hypothetical protein
MRLFCTPSNCACAIRVVWLLACVCDGGHSLRQALSTSSSCLTNALPLARGRACTAQLTDITVYRIATILVCVCLLLLPPRTGTAVYMFRGHDGPHLVFNIFPPLFIVTTIVCVRRSFCGEMWGSHNQGGAPTHRKAKVLCMQ